MESMHFDSVRLNSEYDSCTGPSAITKLAQHFSNANKIGESSEITGEFSAHSFEISELLKTTHSLQQNTKKEWGNLKATQNGGVKPSLVDILQSNNSEKSEFPATSNLEIISNGAENFQTAPTNNPLSYLPPPQHMLMPPLLHNAVSVSPPADMNSASHATEAQRWFSQLIAPFQHNKIALPKASLNDQLTELRAKVMSRDQLIPSALRDHQLGGGGGATTRKPLIETSHTAYQFLSENEFLRALQFERHVNNESHDPLEQLLQIGAALFARGRIAESVCAYEAAVQLAPDCVRGWQQLAIALSENEQDEKGMLAAQHCLQLDARNGVALLSLARVHSNQHDHSECLTAIEQWMRSVGVSSGEVAAVAQAQSAERVSGEESTAIQPNNADFFDENYDVMQVLRNKYLRITQTLQQTGESLKTSGGNEEDDRQRLAKFCDVQTALGILYHCVHDFTRATLSFQSIIDSVEFARGDATLWNKLGSAYCNSGQPERSIDAYRTAIKLSPGFVRARSNLAIACFNIGAFREALDHALIAEKSRLLCVQNSLEKNADKSTTLNDASASESSELSDHLDTNDQIWRIIQLSAEKYFSFDEKNHKLDLNSMDQLRQLISDQNGDKIREYLKEH